MTDRSLTASHLARVLDHRLHITLDTPFHLAKARLYGFTVHDPSAVSSACDHAVRTTFLGDDADVYALLAGPLSLVAAAYDGAGVATSGWAAPVPADRASSALVPIGERPSLHPQRCRVRLVVCVDDSGVAAVMRRADQPADVVDMPERGVGTLADAVESLWFADSAAVTFGSVERRVDRPRRGRHRRSA